MARAKNTSRAEARRQARLDARAELEATRNEEADAAADDAAFDEPVQPRERRSLLSLPNFRQDLRDLPAILTSRRAMIVAPLMLVLGFVLQMANSRGALPADFGLPIPLVGWVSFAAIGDFYVQMFFLPPALLTFFLAGYLAPRASYLFGALNGVLSGALWAVLVLTSPLAPEAPLPGGGQGDALALIGYLFLLNVGYGTFAAAFAAWYRDFLRRMRDQGVARRTERDAQERAKRRDQRQSDRRALKSR